MPGTGRMAGIGVGFHTISSIKATLPDCGGNVDAVRFTTSEGVWIAYCKEDIIMVKSLRKKSGLLGDNFGRRGHERDDDGIIDPGHDLHGNGRGLGHRHGDEDRTIPKSIPENTTFVTDLDHSFRTGVADDGVSYSIRDSVDSDLFTIDPDTGVLSFKPEHTPDFENPGSADGDNVYEVVVRTSVDGKRGFVEHTVEVTVTDVEEDDGQGGQGAAPQVDLVTNLVQPETTGERLIDSRVHRNDAVVAELTASDPDSALDDLTITLSGPDADAFELNLDADDPATPDVLEFELILKHENATTQGGAIGEGEFVNTPEASLFNVTITVTDENGNENEISEEWGFLFLSA